MVSCQNNIEDGCWARYMTASRTLQGGHRTRRAANAASQSGSIERVVSGVRSIVRIVLHKLVWFCWVVIVPAL